jgi:hypothetical protein
LFFLFIEILDLDLDLVLDFLVVSLFFDLLLPPLLDGSGSIGGRGARLLKFVVDVGILGLFIGGNTAMLGLPIGRATGCRGPNGLGVEYRTPSSSCLCGLGSSWFIPANSNNLSILYYLYSISFVYIFLVYFNFVLF